MSAQHTGSSSRSVTKILAVISFNWVNSATTEVDEIEAGKKAGLCLSTSLTPRKPQREKVSHEYFGAITNLRTQHTSSSNVALIPRLAEIFNGNFNFSHI